MILKRFAFAGLLLAAAPAFAQHDDVPPAKNLSFCGTETTPAMAQRIYDYVAQHPAGLSKPTSDVDTVRLSIHMVGTSAGTGYYSLNTLFTLLCQLNERYAPVNMYFALQWPVHYINNDAYYEHDWNAGAQMMQTNKVAGSVNVFFVQDPAGACGYYSPNKDAVAIAKSCAAVNSTTTVHELGHFFSLMHTFYGWEGGGTPANPERVTRGSGANCGSTGDGFCDTDADFLSDRWYCPYTGTMTDANGDAYHPDSSLYMSYSTDACMSRFSAQQVGAIQYNLNVERGNSLIATNAGQYSLAKPLATWPLADTLYADGKRISWSKSAGAQMYYVRVTPRSNASIVRQEALTADTTLDLTFNIVDGSAYTYTVAPLSSVNLCRAAATVLRDTFTFSNAQSPTGIAGMGLNEGNFSVFPNPATASQITIRMEGLKAGSYAIRISNAAGQTVLTQSVKTSGVQQDADLHLGDANPGIYFVEVSGPGGRAVRRLTVQR